MIRSCYVFKACLLLTSLWCAAPAIGQAQPMVQLPAGAQQAIVKFDRGDVLVLIPVTINGKDVGHFIMDTGAGSNVIDQKVAEDLGLPKLGETELGGIGGGRRKGGVYGVGLMQFGEVKVRPHSIAGVDLSALTQGNGVKMCGLLGGEIWASMPFALDYRKQTITFYDREHFVPLDDTCLIRMQPSGPHRNAPVRIDQIADGNAMLDTGYQGGLVFEGSYLALNYDLMKDRQFIETQQVGVGGIMRSSRSAMLDQLRVFGHTFRNVSADFPPEPIQHNPDARPSRVGILGGLLLQHFRLTYDYQTNRLWAELQPDELLPDPLPEGYDIEATDLFGMTPLHRAARWGDAETTRRLIAAGAKLNARQGDGRTALHTAAERQYTDIVRDLLAAKADADAPSTTAQETPLMIAAQRGNVEIVRMLVEAGAKPSARSSRNQHALLLAAMFGKNQAVKYLIDHYDKPVDIDAADNTGLTPLMAAALNGHTDTGRMLLDQGADIDITAKSDGWTALVCAAWSSHADFVKMLIKRGADVNIKNHNGNTALHAAQHKKNAPIIEMILAAGGR